jgi:hypothetical protein
LRHLKQHRAGNERAIDSARQALAHICIVTNPRLFAYQDLCNLVAPMLKLAKSNHELLQFEAGLAMTNLGSAETGRSVLVAQNGWAAAQELLYADNERVQRAGLEVMCNLCCDEAVVERVAKHCETFEKSPGDAPTDIKLFLSFCLRREGKGSKMQSKDQKLGSE